MAYIHPRLDRIADVLMHDASWDLYTLSKFGTRPAPPPPPPPPGRVYGDGAPVLMWPHACVARQRDVHCGVGL